MYEARVAMMKSEIAEIRSSKYDDVSFYGFIAALDGGTNYYFTSQDLVARDQPINRGVKVEFEPFEEGGVRKARKVRILDQFVNQIKLAEDRKIIPKGIKTGEELKSKVLEQFEVLSSTTDYELFEDGVFLLLRLLGIHDAYQYPRSKQAGEPDGFFMAESLAVMYDCTLQKDFENRKRTQIENYANRLSQNSEFSCPGVSKRLPLPPKKQVWIITQGETRELEDFRGIKVKEIAVSDLCEILKQRLQSEGIFYDMPRLVDKLTLMGDKLMLMGNA